MSKQFRRMPNGMPEMRFLTRHDPQAHSDQELLEIAKTLATEEFEKDGDLPPTFMFDNPPGQFTSAFQTVWGGNNEKHAIARTVCKMFSIIGAERYAIIIEMWFLMQKHEPGTTAKEAQERMGLPSQSPDLREGVLIVVHGEGNRPLSFLYEIIRPEGRKPHLIPRPEMAKGGEFIDMTFAPAPATKAMH